MLALAAAVTVVLGVGIAIGSPTVATTGPFLFVASMVDHRRRRSRDDGRALARLMPPLVDELVQQLRAGRSLNQGCTMVLTGLGDLQSAAATDLEPDRHRRQLAALLAPMITAVRDRRTLADGAQSLLASREPSIRLFAVTVRVLALNGGPAVPALQRLRHTLIGVVHGSEQAQTQASQSMASARLMAVAPAVVAVLIGSLQAEAANLYLFEPVGAICVFGSVALSWTGWWWMQASIARLERGLR